MKKLLSYRKAHTKKPKASVQRIKKRHKTKGGRNSDPKKLLWLRRMPCAIRFWCPTSQLFRECQGQVEVHHDRFRGAPANDTKTLPLCAAHHRTGPDSVQVLGRTGFECAHDIDINELTAWYEGHKPK